MAPHMYSNDIYDVKGNLKLFPLLWIYMRKGKKTEQINIRFTEGSTQELDRIADVEDRDRSELVRLLIDWSLSQYDIAGSLRVLRRSNIIPSPIEAASLDSVHRKSTSLERNGVVEPPHSAQSMRTGSRPSQPSAVPDLAAKTEEVLRLGKQVQQFRRGSRKRKQAGGADYER